MAQQLWGGRFGDAEGKTSECLAKLNCSLPLDSRFYAEDIDGSIAYAEALARAGLITDKDAAEIGAALEVVRREWRDGSIKFLSSDEDVHTVNERRLTELIGDVGKRLHTGRSRNDQVITDMKLWLRRGIRETLAGLRAVIEASVEQAKQNLGTLMPGYTHLQRAQPVQFSHWMLSHAFALQADCQRLLELKERANLLPLGSGALAGNPLGVDREWLAKRLNFAGVTPNSMHAVGDRDFVVDFIYCCSLASLHLSRLAEDLILYATKEFDFIKIADGFSTGSSLMPQKRNPDSLELVRGISGSICASLSGIMMTIKGTPTTYNKDLQFDKQYAFDAFDRLQDALTVVEGVIKTMQLNRERMESALSPDMLATDWAYYLVRKGVPFRQAHHYIGEVVAYAEKHGLELNEIPLGELQKICKEFNVDIAQVSDYGVNVEKYDVTGGTATKSVKQQLKTLQNFLEQLKQLK
ncbi:argininosuccinate lyase [Bactrocera neohumeralis]|uniref:argininosuccinate lyase n=1 Tax=Bactrocera neohumeralis TaxID=98809 RepID=UPI00216509A7|nr:argininosuccinate lyase [Bactrocera neohumeralis]